MNFGERRFIEAAYDRQDRQHADRNRHGEARPAGDGSCAPVRRTPEDSRNVYSDVNTTPATPAAQSPVLPAAELPALHRDEVLAVEAGGDQRQSGQRASGDEECPEGDRKLLAQSAHTKDVVLVVQRSMIDAGAEEQQRLEEGVRHEVEDGGADHAPTPSARNM